MSTGHTDDAGFQPRSSKTDLAGLLAAAHRLERDADLLATGDAAASETYTGFARRLSQSVVMPLRSAGIASGDGDSGRSASEDRAPTMRVPEWEQALWELTRDATALRVEPGAPAGLLEATAALQDLVRSRAGDEGVRRERLEQLAEQQRDLAPEIRIEANGPYLVTNPGRVEDWLGVPLETTPQMALCRCGQSKIKPLCDGTHGEVGFTDAKDPDRVVDRRDSYVGQQITVLDNRGACQHSGFCTDRLATVFHLGEEPFVTPSGGRMDEIIRAVRDCPSGALSYAIDGVEAREAVDYHHKRDQTIQVTRDGPYRITGAIPLLDESEGQIERNAGASREHYALCRCGQSQNKPFCSGMHWYVDFHDPPADSSRMPTMFEWCGGLPALTRMTRLFYEKHVPQDPLLAPLFANMSADHPERVAKWLGEVFGGPPRYSDEYGGYPRMLSQHVGKGLTEQWRGRWVALLLQSAQEAGLPNDAEFRSAFQAYIEWGSRLAVENSQSGASPPEHMPMPHWDWNTAAGPPGTRTSAVAPPASEPEEPVVLPAGDEPVRYEKHIRQLFRERDRRSMSFAFDLWTYEDVRKHAEEILERVRNGSMPCDGAWPQDWVQTFARWTDTGFAA
jgi:CDGSH-type Zn-finger protein/truncated hemoglobin YjbI